MSQLSELRGVEAACQCTSGGCSAALSDASKARYSRASGNLSSWPAREQLPLQRQCPVMGRCPATMPRGDGLLIVFVCVHFAVPVQVLKLQKSKERAAK